MLKSPSLAARTQLPCCNVAMNVDSVLTAREHTYEQNPSQFNPAVNWSCMKCSARVLCVQVGVWDEKLMTLVTFIYFFAAQST